MKFDSRLQAGQQLAERLGEMHWNDPVVLGLVRGGIEVAFPVALRLGAPLDVAVARKIGAPRHPEFGVGAVTADGDVIYDRQSLQMLGLTEDVLTDTRRAEHAEAQRRQDTYRAGMPQLELSGRDVIVVDDGIATGVTARATLRSLRKHKPSRIVLAVPVCDQAVEQTLGDDTAQVVCLHMPSRLEAIGLWYNDFEQLSDQDVLGYLRQARDRTRL